MERELIDLYRIEILNKYNKYYNFLASYGEQLDKVEILPNYLKEDYLKDLIEVDTLLNHRDNNHNFVSRFDRYKTLFKSLKPCSLNSIYLKAFCEVEKNESIRNNLLRFRKLENRKNLQYLLADNITGRLVIKKGPNILTLPRKYRSIIDTRFKNGEVLSVDFTSLEPRFCLNLLGKEVKGDLYESLKETLELEVDRSVIKRAIISVLYGAHYTSLKGISENKAKDLFNCIKDYFDFDKLLKESLNVDELGIRRNYFGRPLWNLSETKENILINNYVQSSAVDVSLTYFSDLISQIDLEKYVPLYVLHDAIIFDINKDYKNDFVNIIKKGYNHEKLGHFPLDIDIFNTKSQE